MRVGALEETITVTGEAPVVDVQGVARQRTLSADVIDAVPTGRNYTNLGVLDAGDQRAVRADLQLGIAGRGRDVGRLAQHADRARQPLPRPADRDQRDDASRGRPAG